MASVMIATEYFSFSGELPIPLHSMNPSGITTSPGTNSNAPLCLTSLYGFVRRLWGDLGKKWQYETVIGNQLY